MLEGGKIRQWSAKLLTNNRFWIITVGLVISVCIAGIVQLIIPSNSLQIIRTEQIYGYISVILLISALLISPITKLSPHMQFKDSIIHSRRAIGVLAFFYGFLHSWLTFFMQLGGFEGVAYYNEEYRWSLFFGGLALVILFIMSATSIDWIVNAIGFKRWKLLHRLVYMAGISVVIHIILIGSHFDHINLFSITLGTYLVILLYFQSLRLIRSYKRRDND